MRTRHLPLLFVLSLPLAVRAAPEVEVETRTLLLGRGESPGVEAAWPFYQWIEVSGRDREIPGLSAHASLWGMGALDTGGRDGASDGRLAGDINLFYGAYQDPSGHYALRLGRQILLGGAGTGFFGHIDGLWARAAYAGVEAEGYAGRVVTPRFSNLSQADWLAGGRVGYRRWGRLAAGASFLEARNDKRIARELFGMDLALGAWKGWDGTFDLSLDLLRARLAEGTLSVRGQPIEDLTIGLTLHHARPESLLDQSSIFSVFGLGSYAQGGLFAELRINDHWNAGLAYDAVFFPAEDGSGLGAKPAHRVRIHTSLYLGRALWLRVAADRLPTEDNAYTGLRLAARWRPDGKLSAGAEVLAYLYDRAPFTRSDARARSLTGILFADYALRGGLHLGLGGQVGEGVLATLDARLTLRLTWMGSFGGGES